MPSKKFKEGHAFTAPVFAALCAVLAALALPSEVRAWTGQPLIYVSNDADNTISVIDTGNNTVVNTIRGMSGGLRVAPDGERLYVFHGRMISIIDPRTSKVSSTIPEPDGFLGVSPNGKRLYRRQGDDVIVVDLQGNTVLATIPIPTTVWEGVTVSNFVDGISFTPSNMRVYLTTHYTPDSTVSVIDTRTNSVVRTLKPGNLTAGGAETPDGKFVYFVDQGLLGGSPVTCSSTLGDVTVFDTATGQRLATIDGRFVGVPTITPNGTRAYVVNGNLCGDPFGTVTVLATATNTVLGAPIPVGYTVGGLVVGPDGRRVYATNSRPGEGTTTCVEVPSGPDVCTTTVPGYVSVIDTATNRVIATVPVGNNVGSIAIVAPPQGKPFTSFTARLDLFSKRHALVFRSEFTASSGIHFLSELVKLQIGPYVAGIPTSSFKIHRDGLYTYEGTFGDDADLRVWVERTGALRYALQAELRGVDVSGITNPVQVSVSVGDDAGLTSGEAHFHHHPGRFDNRVGLGR